MVPKQNSGGGVVSDKFTIHRICICHKLLQTEKKKKKPPLPLPPPPPPPPHRMTTGGDGSDTVYSQLQAMKNWPISSTA
jgi:hypothetical protein